MFFSRTGNSIKGYQWKMVLKDGWQTGLIKRLCDEKAKKRKIVCRLWNQFKLELIPT